VKKLLLVLGSLALVVGPASRGQDKVGHADDKEHVVVRPDAIKWGPAPPGLPPGSEAAVLAGDPGKAGPFVLRAKLPDGYKIPPHWHTGEENITVLKGTFLIGRGDKLDPSTMEELPAGSFMSMPKTMRHFAMAKGETIIQVHGIGPFDITYVNAADDPRKKDGKK
jgi:quercetin dioxygenase-like cupin family protein